MFYKRFFNCQLPVLLYNVSNVIVWLSSVIRVNYITRSNHNVHRYGHHTAGCTLCYILPNITMVAGVKLYQIVVKIFVVILSFRLWNAMQFHLVENIGPLIHTDDLHAYRYYDLFSKNLYYNMNIQEIVIQVH